MRDKYDFIRELVQVQLIDKTTADNILTHYQKQEQNQPGKSNSFIMLAFGVIGAVLVGLGIILVFAHNWDNFSKWTKNALAFTPLLIAQILAFYALVKNKSKVWRESSAVLLIGSIAASISLIAQIYHLPSDFFNFILIWALLVAPIIYIMQSAVASLIYLLLSLIFILNLLVGYDYSANLPSSYWIFLLLVVNMPFYVNYLKSNFVHKIPSLSQSNFMAYENLFISLIALFTLFELASEYQVEQIIFISFFAFFALLFVLSKQEFLKVRISAEQKFFMRFLNGQVVFKAMAFFGSVILLFLFSYSSFWQELDTFATYSKNKTTFFNLEFCIFVALFMLASLGLYFYKRAKAWRNLNPLSYAFIFMSALLILNIFLPWNLNWLYATSVNLMLVFIGVRYIKQGNQCESIGQINLGINLIALLIFLRFLDLDLSFLSKGLIFILFGISLFGINAYMLKKWRQDETNR